MNRTRIRGHAVIGAFALAMLAACTALPPITPSTDASINARATAPDGMRPPDYVLETFRTKPRDTIVVFAFSGGGTRSAAFGYGVLKAAHETTIASADGSSVRLSDRIDIVSGVSGGAFTAAAFAEHRDDNGFLLSDVNDKCADDGSPDLYCTGFLVQDFDAAIATGLLVPWYWISPDWNMSEQMAANYANVPWGTQRMIFGKDGNHPDTFGTLIQAQIAKSGNPLPFLVIQATDYRNAQPFTFTQNDFDLLCTDVSNVPITRALAAANGFPVLFNPVPIEDFAVDSADRNVGACAAAQPPKWAPNPIGPDDLSRRDARAQIASDYRDDKAVIHDSVGKGSEIELVDGGVADNLALSGLMNIVAESLGEEGDPIDPATGGAAYNPVGSACALGLDRVKNILVVSVDGESQPDNSASTLPVIGKLVTILGGVFNTAIDSNDFETLQAGRAFVDRFRQRLEDIHCNDPAGNPRRTINATFAHVSFWDVALDREPTADCGEKNLDRRCRVSELASGSTKLTFSAQDIDDLVVAGKEAFRCNARLQRNSGLTLPKHDPDSALTCALPAITNP
jgi:predicted acylesterase/phospholipase RssA